MQKKIYLDNGATTPLCPEAKAAMERVMADDYGNPSGNYSLGFSAKKILNDSRAEIASALNCYESEIIFTSGGTESDNLAVIGGALANGARGRHIVTTAIEHHAVLNSCRFLETLGFKVTYVKPDPTGIVPLDSVKEALRPDTVLISVMHANNETGVLQPIEEIGEFAGANNVLFHTDAVCTFEKIPLDMSELKADFLSVSAHKINGPKGVGLMYIRKGTKISNLIHGGAQESGRRAGTTNAAGIIGFAKATELATAKIDKVNEYQAKLRDKLIKRVLEEIPYTRVNGHLTERLSNNANFCFRFVEGESLLILLDQAGICASSGSACTSGSLDPSHVLLAIGLPHEIAHGSVRLTISEETTEEDIDYTVESLKKIIERLRSMSPLYEDFVKKNKEA